MSNSKKLANGTLLIEFDDAVEFFRRRTNLPCPACGHTSWNMFTSSPAGDVEMGVALTTTNLETGALLSQSVPIVMVTCKKCAFVRMHHMLTISKWAEDGKPDFADEQA